MSNEQKMDADPGRTRIHLLFIAAINVLTRVAEKEGVDVYRLTRLFFL